MNSSAVVPKPDAVAAHTRQQKRTSHILIVDPDQFLQEMIEAGFRLYDPAFTILKAEDPEGALALLARHRVQLIITELHFPQAVKKGVEFLLALEDEAPHVPVIVLTEAHVEDFRDLTAATAIIPKPPDMDYLLSKVTKVLQESRESILRGISLESFLQVLEVEKKTCTLTVVSGPATGNLYISEGELIHAETSRFDSKAAVFAMLSWPDYSIKITEHCDAEPTITERLNAILMEWCVQKDHGLI